MRDSGYPTKEVVNTDSPDMLVLAPNDLPEKMGPFRMVKVARSFDGAVDRGCGNGIARVVFESTVAKPR